MNIPVLVVSFGEEFLDGLFHQDIRLDASHAMLTLLKPFHRLFQRFLFHIGHDNLHILLRKSLR